MKKLLMILGLAFFVIATTHANPFKKNQKAWDGAFEAKNEAYTAPRIEQSSPAIKNNGVILDMSKKVALNNPDPERLNSPFYKNKKHFQPSPMLKFGELEMVKI